MLAAWYETPGDSSVLQVGDLPDPAPRPGEVRVRLTRSGVNPGDVAKREDRFGAGLPFARIVPHSDGAGTIDAVGDGVDAGRVGERVWVYGAQNGRPSGTAAQYTVVPAANAVAAPDGLTDDLGACLGVPGITAHRAVLADGPVDGRTVLVHGVRGAVASMAAQLAAAAGATVVGTVRGPVSPDDRWPVVSLDDDPAAAIRAVAPDGVDRIVEVAFSDNVDLDVVVARAGAVVAAYNSPDATPAVPYWPLSIKNMILRFVGSNTFAPDVVRQAAGQLTGLAASGALRLPVGRVFDLDQVAAAQDLVESGAASGRVLVRIP